MTKRISMLLALVFVLSFGVFAAGAKNVTGKATVQNSERREERQERRRHRRWRRHHRRWRRHERREERRENRNDNRH